ncbi:MAG TPA: hypothetical protein VF773_04895 [Verrucomicrobiae bacterium]
MPTRIGHLIFVSWLTFFCVLAEENVAAGEARVVKVLTHLVDSQNRTALAPSLYERDAYQLHLRNNTNLVSGMRFEVQFKASRKEGPVTVRIEARGSKSGLGHAQVFETEVLPERFFSTWARVRLDKTQTDALGTVVAWRASLWRDGQLLAEQQSFLW